MNRAAPPLATNEVPEAIDVPPTDRPGSSWARWTLIAAICLGSAALARWQLGYRSFPALDDYTYVPMALSRLDRETFANDYFLQSSPMHMPLLPLLVHWCEATVGMPAGFWCATWALSLLTIVGLARCLRSLGGAGYSLPLVVAIACTGRVDGLGRGDYDGIFGESFHFQWVALCGLVWSYSELLRRRWGRAALWLGLTAVFHPVVGAHGFVVATFALCAAFPLVRAAQRAAATASLALGGVGLAFVAWLALAAPTGVSIDELEVSTRGILFRLPHEFELDRVKSWLFLAVIAAGWWATLHRLRQDDATGRVLAALMTGQLTLFAAGCACYEARAILSWSSWTFLPFQLSLTRTTPILLALSAVAIAVCCEKGVQAIRSNFILPRGIPNWFRLFAGTFAAFVIAAFQVRWGVGTLLGLGLAGATWWLAATRGGAALAIGAWLTTAVAAGGLSCWNSELETPLPIAQRELFNWIARETSSRAVFVIPPSLQEFRLATRRSAYVDFKVVTPANRRLVAEWRTRLERVAHPDALARAARGWDGVVEWDRTYASRNSPRRIESVLSDTGAEYFVWDREGLRIPPFLARDDSPVDNLELVFANARYEVWRRIASDERPPSDDGRDSR